jgi:hypothetical protein
VPEVDIGESLVGAYLRHVGGCDVVTYNSFFADRQGEVDVVGIKNGEPRTIWLCEVTTHIGGMLITSRGDRPQEVILREKLERLYAFAEATFPGDTYRYEWWSPYVAVGKLTDVMQGIEADWKAAGRDLRFVKNEEYTVRIHELATDAKKNSSTTNEPAYRMLQVLTRLRGGKFEL